MLALAAEKFVDDKLAAKAEVVLRVKRLTPGVGSKYLWYRVEVLQVLKNQSSETFTNTLSVAAYSWKDGVPEGVSILYLERYNQTDKELWKIVKVFVPQISLISGNSNLVEFATKYRKIKDDIVRNKEISVMVRAQLIEPGEGSKYLWDKIKILEVIRNTSSYKFPSVLSVARESIDPPLPDEECILILEYYNPNRKDLWEIVQVLVPQI